MNRDDSPDIPASPRHRRRRWLYAAMAAALLVAFHAPLLRGLWYFVVVNAPHAGKSDVLLIDDHIETVRAVVELHEQGRVERVLLTPGPLRETDLLKITESATVEMRRELTSRGIPDEAIRELETPGFGIEPRALACQTYLREFSERRVTIATARLQGRNVQRIFATTIEPSLLPRIAFASTAPARYDERNWWKVRVAVQHLFRAYLHWFLGLTIDLPTSYEERIDWKAYEAAIARGEKP